MCVCHIPLVPRTASPLPDRMEDCGRNPEKGERKGGGRCIMVVF